MPTRTQQLNVSITPHFSRFIRRKINSGRYSSASEVVREALRHLEQAELIGEQSLIVDPDDARDAVLQGAASIDRGDAVELKDEAALREFFEDIVARGKQRLAAKNRVARR
jgi:antitoxin ParD1/3/4